MNEHFVRKAKEILGPDVFHGTLWDEARQRVANAFLEVANEATSGSPARNLVIEAQHNKIAELQSALKEKEAEIEKLVHTINLTYKVQKEKDERISQLEKELADENSDICEQRNKAETALRECEGNLRKVHSDNEIRRERISQLERELATVTAATMETVTENAEFRAALNLAQGAFNRIIDGVPACNEGGLYVEHFDEVGNPVGTEQVDPMAVISCIVGCATSALSSDSIKREAERIAKLEHASDMLDEIDELLPHHSRRDITGVSIIDDVRDLVKEAEKTRFLLNDSTNTIRRGKVRIEELEAEVKKLTGGLAWFYRFIKDELHASGAECEWVNKAKEFAGYEIEERERLRKEKDTFVGLLAGEVKMSGLQANRITELESKLSAGRACVEALEYLLHAGWIDAYVGTLHKKPEFFLTPTKFKELQDALTLAKSSGLEGGK
jgi:hypothetical protein